VKETFQLDRLKGIDSPAIEGLIGAMEDSGVIDQAQKQGTVLLDKAFASFVAHPWVLLEKTQTAFRELRTQMGNTVTDPTAFPDK
jgi:hypothetical protein